MLPYEMTVEENKAIVDAQVEAHFHKKKPPPKEKISPEVVEKFVRNFQKPAKKPAIRLYPLSCEVCQKAEDGIRDSPE